jgi:tight adherence protein B
MMFILIFLFTLAIVFGILLVGIKPSKDQVRVEKRLENIRSPKNATSEAALKLEELLSTPDSESFDWLEGLFSRATSTEKFRILLLQADCKWSAGTLLFLWMTVLVGVYSAIELTTRLTMLAVIVAGLSSIAPFAYLNMKRAKRVNAFNKSLPECIEMIVRALRAGYSIVAAMQVVAEQAVEPAKSEFAEVYRKQNYGLPLRDALMEMLDRIPSNDLRVLITGVLVQKDTGGNLAELLERIAVVIRERVRIQGEIRTHTAQGRMTGWILSGLPLIVMIALNLVSPGYSTPLFSDPFGQKMLYVGGGLLVIGTFAIRKIINGIEV